MKKLEIDYALIQALDNNVDKKRLKNFFKRFNYIVGSDIETVEYLRELYSKK